MVVVARRFKETEPFTSKDFTARHFEMTTTALERSWPRIHGRCNVRNGETQTSIRRGRTEIHRDQAIMERFNRTLTERLLGHQYAVEMRLPAEQRFTAWVTRLFNAVSALNNKAARLIGNILGDPGALSCDDRMSMVNV